MHDELGEEAPSNAYFDDSPDLPPLRRPRIGDCLLLLR